MIDRNKVHAYVIDPNEESRRTLVSCVPEELFRVSEFETGEAARETIENDPPGLIICEVRLPDCSGFSLCSEVRLTRDTAITRIILMSDWSSEMDRIFALEAGADDYVSRPYSQREFTSRVKAICRRPISESAPKRLGSKGLDSTRPKVADEQPEDLGAALEGADPLTRTESLILEALMRSGDRPSSRKDLVASIWKSDQPPSPRYVDTYVKSLRRKLSGSRVSIETVWGIGYRLNKLPPEFEGQSEDRGA